MGGGVSSGMGLIDNVRDAFASPSPKGRPDDGSEGAYWCDDCDNRLRDVELDVEPGEDVACPDCGEPMRFERSSGRDCAC
jgi:DNA-directed RNA polymerase subunit RPC12/RpoP